MACKHMWTDETIEEEDMRQYMTCEFCGARGPELADDDIDPIQVKED